MEKLIKQKLIDRGFSEETLLNNRGLIGAVIDETKEAITVTHCCTELKADNKKLSFKDWKHSKGMRYLSGHTYKDNDGDLYDSDELEKMYQNYISL